MNSAPSVCIVIPVYQNTLSASEHLSLAQCVKILGKFSIKLAKPENLNIDPIVADYPQIGSVSFGNQYFGSTDTYNQLLTSIDFYKAFDSYDFILIYQLDAYVFKDALLHWCNAGYDYIGAPSIHLKEFDALPEGKSQEFEKMLSRHRLVYNGGLSLRRISAFIRYLKIYNAFYPKWVGNEDMLFSQEATRLYPMRPFMKLPSWKIALNFAFEKSPAASFEITKHQLPFACHAWERYDRNFWEPYI